MDKKSQFVKTKAYFDILWPYDTSLDGQTTTILQKTTIYLFYANHSIVNLDTNQHKKVELTPNLIIWWTYDPQMTKYDRSAIWSQPKYCEFSVNLDTNQHKKVEFTPNLIILRTYDPQLTKYDRSAILSQPKYCEFTYK